MRLSLIAIFVLVGAVLLGSRSIMGAHSDTPAVQPTGSSIDQIVVNPSAIKRVIPSTFFGINYSAFWDRAANSPASARALAQTPIRSLRFPGGVIADFYDWQNPYYKNWSHTSPAQLWSYARSFGSRQVVFGTNFLGGNLGRKLPDPPGKPYAVNSPQNAAAWVAYNRSVKIPALMEVGNEADLKLLKSLKDPAFSAYVDAFNSQATAMHRADPHVQVLGPVGVNEYYWWARGGLHMFLEGAGNRSGTGQVDGVSLHFYKGSSWFNAKGVAQYWLSDKGPWAAIQRIIRETDTRKLSVYMTEWNVGPSDFHNAFNPTLGHALVVADMIGAFATSGVAGEYYWQTHGAHGWGLLYGKGEGRPVDSPTPGYYAMALWRHMGNRVVPLQQSADAANNVSAYATTRKNGSLQVLLINKQATPSTARIALQRATPAGHRLHVYSLTGIDGGVDGLDVRYDGVTMPSPSRTLPGPTDKGIIHGKTLAYTVPPFSAVVLDLSGTSPAPGITWESVPTASPLPPLDLRLSGNLDRPSPTPGDMETLTATLTSNQDVGPLLVDFEVYSPTNAKVFQTTETVNLVAGKATTVTKSYTVPPGAGTGKYFFKLGVFGPAWSPQYAWDNGAGNFTVGG